MLAGAGGEVRSGEVVDAAMAEGLEADQEEVDQPFDAILALAGGDKPDVLEPAP